MNQMQPAATSSTHPHGERWMGGAFICSRKAIDTKRWTASTVKGIRSRRAHDASASTRTGKVDTMLMKRNHHRTGNCVKARTRRRNKP